MRYRSFAAQWSRGLEPPTSPFSGAKFCRTEVSDMSQYRDRFGRSQCTSVGGVGVKGLKYHIIEGWRRDQRCHAASDAWKARTLPSRLELNSCGGCGVSFARSPGVSSTRCEAFAEYVVTHCG